MTVHHVQPPTIAGKLGLVGIERQAARSAEIPGQAHGHQPLGINQRPTAEDRARRLNLAQF